MTSRELLALAVVAAPAAVAAPRSPSPRAADRAASRSCGAVATLATAAALAVAGADRPGPKDGDNWLVLDAAGGADRSASSRLVGFASVLALTGVPRDLARARSAARPRARSTSCCLFAFWAIAARRAACGQPRRRVAADRGDDRDLGAARRLQRQAPRARGRLEVPDPDLARARRRAARDRAARRRGPGRRPRLALAGARSRPTRRDDQTALVAYLLLLAGLAAKIGWAPVHNWLPDAHSEAPPPVSALLSAALLPAVLLVAWRSEHALAPVIGAGHRAATCLIGFGLVSLAVAVPFLWRPLAWKRLLAYSSLEHMGVIALGIGFGSPARAGRRRDPHRRARRRQGARLLRRDAAAWPRAPLGRARRSPASDAPSPRSARRWASRSQRSRACRRRPCSSARC